MLHITDNISEQTISDIDVLHLEIVRKSVTDFLQNMAARYDKKGIRLLDIAPQIHAGAKAHFKQAKIETLDIEDSSGADYIADLCACNEQTIPEGSFDIVVCTEVLEHTLQPFDAVNEIERILAPNGITLITVPFNLRIHGPLPDCWRFTEHGLRSLFKNFKIEALTSINDQNRFLMPIHYQLIATKL